VENRGGREAVERALRVRSGAGLPGQEAAI